MRALITPSALSGTVLAVSSKSEAQRALICAALSDRPTRLLCEASGDDIGVTANALTALGAKTERACGVLTVFPIMPGQVRRAEFDCGDNASALHFLLCVTCALGVQARIGLSESLSRRPHGELLKQLSAHGCSVECDGNVISVSGRLIGGDFELDGGISSQYVSGLLLALPLVGGGITVSGNVVSEPYIEMTRSMLGRFGIPVTREKNVYSVPRSAYRSPGELVVGGDWSGAAFWLAAGAMSDKTVRCEGLDLGSCQGDRRVVDLLRSLGADIRLERNAVVSAGGQLHGGKIDAGNIPDLVPALAAAACAAHGETLIYNAGRLRYKESDRLGALRENLGRLGADITETSDGLIVRGSGGLRGGVCSSERDHRIAMALAVASSICAETVTIYGAEAVSKSYRGFFDDFKKLGGVCALSD